MKDLNTETAQILKYLAEEKHCFGMAAEHTLAKITKYDDIKQEFLRWLEQRNYDNEDALIVEGYNARTLYDLAPQLDGAGVYNFLVDLRDQPDVAKKIIAEGFKVR